MKKEKGITLIALVITIIVLLILAGVTVVTLTGDNGLLQKATNAKEENEEAKELELIKLAVSSAKIAGEGTITTKNLSDELKSNFDFDIINLDEKSGGWFFKKNKEYTIYNDGKVQEGNLLLPKEYQEVEYIQTTGGQWINTNISIEFGYSFIVDCKMNESNNLAWNTIVGAYNDGSNKFRFVFNPNGKEIIGYIDGSGGVKSCQNIFNRGVATIRFISGNNYFEFNNVNFYTNQTSFGQSVSGTFLLFCDNRGKDYFKGNIYSVRINDINNNLCQNLIPCYRINDNIVGLYDTVAGKFYTNQGTGEFIAGPEV